MKTGEIPLPKFLTKRQQQTLALHALGKNTKGVADELGISTKTVEYHRMQSMIRLNMFSIVELTHYALATGLIKNMFEAQAKTDFVKIATAEPVINLQQATDAERKYISTLLAKTTKNKPSGVIAPFNSPVGIISSPDEAIDKRINVPKDGKWRNRRYKRSTYDKYATEFNSPSCHSSA